VKNLDVSRGDFAPMVDALIVWPRGYTPPSQSHGVCERGDRIMGRFRLKRGAVSKGVSLSARLVKNFHQWSTILEEGQETFAVGASRFMTATQRAVDSLHAPGEAVLPVGQGY
jgi:hypothetical protein